MKIDVGKAIAELLYEHPVVIIPGLGGFTAATTPASLDYVQGNILPPSKRIDFNPNLVINDGVLVHHIQQSETITAQEASEAITKFVDEINQALNLREIVEIKQIGRLYKDYEHKIRFLPEDSNLNADSFGLPPVRLAPLLKDRNKEKTAFAFKSNPPPVADVSVVTEQATPAPVSNQETIPATPQPSSKKILYKILPPLVLVTAIALAVVLYLQFGRSPKESISITDKERVNVKPQPEYDPKSPTSTENQSSNTSTQPVQPETKKSFEYVNEESEEQSPGVTSSGKQPQGAQMIMVIHSFGVKENAEKFVRTLTQDGYTPVVKKVGRLHRVGIALPSANPADVERIRQELAARYKASPKTEKELDEELNR